MEGLYRQPRRSMDLGLTDIWMTITFGASGLPVLKQFNSENNPPDYSDAPSDGGSPATYGPVQNLSIVRNSAGNYTITFRPDAGGVPRLFGISQYTWECPTGLPNTPNIASLASSSPVSYAAAFTFVTSTGGVATDPTSGNTLKAFVSFQQY